MNYKKFQLQIFFILIFTIFLSACVLPAQKFPHPQPLEIRYKNWQKTLVSVEDIHNDPLSVNIPTPLADETQALGNFVPTNLPRLYLHPGVPSSIVATLNFSEFDLTPNADDADTQLILGKRPTAGENVPHSTWVYALVAPFYTRIDSISSDDVISLWKGNHHENFPFLGFYLTKETLNVMTAFFGQPGEGSFNIISSQALHELALSDKMFLSLVPFETLEPRWKVIQIDEQSPIDVSFSPDKYPLTALIWIDENLDELEFSLDDTNFDPGKKTVLMMTGVTALTRATAYRMETHGNLFPGEDVYDWFSSADLVHISNEVSFAENCPFPDPVQPDLKFCSSPDRIELLDFIGTNIIDLSGNHLLDYGPNAINLTLNMYDERNWSTFAGGWNLEEARSPALINHNGNQLAFLGCNPVGPPVVWATDTQAGSAPCGDYQWLIETIKALREDGYLPIVTLQYAEDYTAIPSPMMIVDFDRIAQAGAVFVSGSQAHTPKSMVFSEDAFIHYGLGNLFFDQMEVFYNEVLIEGTREGFIDRVIFYDGRLVSIELLSTMLEDYARPRPMMPHERDALLKRIFNVALEAYK